MMTCPFTGRPGVTGCSGCNPDDGRPQESELNGSLVGAVSTPFGFMSVDEAVELGIVSPGLLTLLRALGIMPAALLVDDQADALPFGGAELFGSPEVPGEESPSEYGDVFGGEESHHSKVDSNDREPALV